MTVLIILFAVPVFADRGEVVRTLKNCDFFIVEVEGVDYAVIESWDLSVPDKKDELIGEFNTYGMVTLYNKTQDLEIEVYIEDYMLFEDEASRILFEKCE
ncbi:MAG: hypothetical protein KY459_01525 [Acidobacteria bacterium]|nr:hypothetical protein [Acidobacteriota bacterium]